MHSFIDGPIATASTAFHCVRLTALRSDLTPDQERALTYACQGAAIEERPLGAENEERLAPHAGTLNLSVGEHRWRTQGQAAAVGVLDHRCGSQVELWSCLPGEWPGQEPVWLYTMYPRVLLLSDVESLHGNFTTGHLPNGVWRRQGFQGPAPLDEDTLAAIAADPEGWTPER